MVLFVDVFYSILKSPIRSFSTHRILCFKNPISSFSSSFQKSQETDIDFSKEAINETLDTKNQDNQENFVEQKKNYSGSSFHDKIILERYKVFSQEDKFNNFIGINQNDLTSRSLKPFLDPKSINYPIALNFLSQPPILRSLPYPKDFFENLEELEKQIEVFFFSFLFSFSFSFHFRSFF